MKLTTTVLALLAVGAVALTAPRSELAVVRFSASKPKPLRAFVSLWLAGRDSAKWKLRPEVEGKGVVIDALDAAGAPHGDLRVEVCDDEDAIRVESSGGAMPFLLQEAVLVGALCDELAGIWEDVERDGEVAVADRIFAFDDDSLEAFAKLRRQFASSSMDEL